VREDDLLGELPLEARTAVLWRWWVGLGTIADGDRIGTFARTGGSGRAVLKGVCMGVVGRREQRLGRWRRAQAEAAISRCFASGMGVCIFWEIKARDIWRQKSGVKAGTWRGENPQKDTAAAVVGWVIRGGQWALKSIFTQSTVQCSLRREMDGSPSALVF